MSQFSQGATNSFSETDLQRRERWNYFLKLRSKVILCNGRVKISRALAGDQPEKLRARLWSQRTARHGLEAMYLAQLASKASQASRLAEYPEDALRLAREAQELRARHLEEQTRYELCGHYDALALKKVIEAELQEIFSALNLKKVFLETSLHKEGLKISNSHDRIELFSQQLESKLSDSSPNAPNKIQATRNSEGVITQHP